MRRFDSDHYDVGEIVVELLKGDGAVVFPGLFPPDEIAEARQIIMDRSSAEPPRVTHFQGKAEIENRLNRILPGGPGQEPHIDYPYWDFHKPESFPIHLNASFPMNAQVTIILDPFTKESGATAFVPGSQRDIRYPAESDGFYERCEQMLGEPGDAIVFFGAAWHCAMPNKSTHDRTGILIEYLPKFVKPVEDMLTTLDEDFKRTMSPMMRQLLGFNYPHPQLFDEAEAKSAEGRVKKVS
jgi:ectoine hydroxylase-related dioxygenase (phytanoyl-CoA dioxygenase family)